MEPKLYLFNPRTRDEAGNTMYLAKLTGFIYE
jgi:hypothetical protein